MNTSMHKKAFRILPVLAALIAAYPAISEANSGRFQFVHGDVRVIDGLGHERIAQKGGDINEGETVTTAPGASAQLRMNDGGFLALRPDTRLQVETYRYSGKEDGSEKSLLSLFKGGFRAITGLIGHTNKDNYQIRTPSATIGIRGTDHEPMYIPPPRPGEIPVGTPGAYDKVNVGQAYIKTDRGIANISPNQVGYVASAGAVPAILPKIPDFYKATPEQRKVEERQGQDKKADTGKKAVGGGSSGNAKSTSSATTASGNGAVSSEGSTTASSTTTSTESTGTASSTASGESTTTTTSTTASTTTAPTTTSEPLRTTTTADTTLLASTAPVTTTTTSQTLTTTAPATTSSTLTGETSAGNVINTTNQTLTTSSGTTISLQGKTALTNVLSAYGFNPNCAACGTFWTEARDYWGTALFDGSGNLLSITDAGFGKIRSESISPSGAGGVVNSTVNAGVSAGWWQGGVVTRSDPWSTSSPSVSTLTGYHWVSGPDVSPNFLPMVLTGTASYVVDVATPPTDDLGKSGTFGSAAMAINFSQQAVTSLSISATDSRGWNWGASKNTPTPLHGEGSFNVHTNSPDPNQQLAVTVANTGGTTLSTPFGSVSGSLFGANLSGAGMAYTFGAFDALSPNSAYGLSGAVALSTTPLTAPASSFGLLTAFGDTGLGSVNSPENYAYVDMGLTAQGTVTNYLAAAGSFPGWYPRQYMASVTEVDERPVMFTTSVAAVESGSAAITDTATSTTANIQWGRWANSSVTYALRYDGTQTGSMPATAAFVHGLKTDNISMPLTGTASYTLATGGGAAFTTPTDQAGNLWTLKNVTINADFSARTVSSLAVQVDNASSAPTMSLTASATNVPIMAPGVFMANSMSSAAPLAVSCAGTCGAVSGGQVGGAFVANGAGVGLAYSLVNADATMAARTTVTGVAALRK